MRMTLEPFVQDNRLPEAGTQVYITHITEPKGFSVKIKHITVRRCGEIGTYTGPVPGHGGDVVWVQHGQTIGAYTIDELMRVWDAPAPNVCAVRGCKKDAAISFGSLRLSLCYDCKIEVAGRVALGMVEL